MGKIRPRKKKPTCMIALDVGGTKLASAVITLDGKVLAKTKEPMEFSKGKKGFIEFLTQSALGLKKQFPEAAGVGIASCGPLDSEKGILLQPTNFPRWGNIEIVAPLKKSLKLPVSIENDAAAAALAEGWHGGAKKLKNWIVLTLGTGLGAGIVMDRKAFHGGSGLGAEAGHMIVTDRKYLCGCGNYGCAEAVLSGTALKRRIQEEKLSYASPKALIEGAKNQEPEALRVFSEYKAVMSRTVHNLAVMYNPKEIFFSGGISVATDLFLEDCEKEIGEMLKNRPGFTPKLSLSKLGNDLGVYGGAFVGFSKQNLFNR